MDFAVKGGKPENLRTDCLIVTTGPGTTPTGTAAALDGASKGRVRRVLGRGDLAAAPGSTLMLPDLEGVRADRVLLVRTGKGDCDDAGFRKIVRGAIGPLLAGQAADAVLALDGIAVKDRDLAWLAGEAVQLMGFEAYRFNDYISEPGDAGTVRLKKLALHTGSGARAAISRAVKQAAIIADGTNYARTLGNLPGNVCHPSYLAEEARKLGREHTSIKVRIVEERSMRSMGMGAFLSVTAGSDQPAKLIVMEYKGGGRRAAGSRKPVVLVGKGVTFDTGGISIKPGAGMDEMKFDMCGAASVFGVMQAVARLGLPIDVVGLVAAAENMPSGGASRPGDIVTTMSGQTVEILNTDAEGRLVLCDTLTYAERYKPSAVVDVATLTGAAVVALGAHATALYANDDGLAEDLLAAGEATGDRAWRMPLWEDYQQQLKTNFADMANVGGREAGSVTAACFLARYTRSYKWAHLDIAGTGWKSGAGKGATGRPVRLLTEWLVGGSH
ncbi:MAG TPA: leucyl aminopeptidase [Pseudomonadales bacterium]|nr:leucyl aminopeptidase [Pseudomonadales bacterium]